MTVKTTIASIDGFVYQADASKWFGGLAKLDLRGSGTGEQRRAFLYFPSPVPAGANVLSATLFLAVRATAWGGQSVTAQRITQSWNQPNWNTQPSSTATGQASASGPLAVDERFEIDVTAIVAAWAAGSANLGVRLHLGQDVLRHVWSREAAGALKRPALVVDYSFAPSAPTDLRPSDSRAFSIGQPTFAWNRQGVGDQAAAQVQIATDAGFGSIVWDSGWVATSEQQMAVFASPPATGTPYFWRVRVRDSAGVESDWSTTAETIRTAKGSLGLTSPVSTTVDTATPTLTHTFTGTQVSAEWEVWLGNQRVAHFPRSATAALTKQVAPALVAEDDYRWVVRVWDNVAREVTPGDPDYVEAEATFTYERAAVTPPTSLVLSKLDASPIVKVAFSRSSAPTYFRIYRDGALVAQVTPGEVLVGGTSYEYLDYGAVPGVEHTWEVSAVTTDVSDLKETTGNPTDTFTAVTRGIWILVPGDPALTVMVAGLDSFEVGESSEVFFPNDVPVKVRDHLRGYEGRVSGSLRDHNGVTIAAYKQRLEDVNALVGEQEIRLAQPNYNIPVLLDALNISPDPGRPDSGLLASFDVYQAGEVRWA